MRNALLVAWREYAENAKTKGFWIGILLFPVILIGCIQVPLLLETRGTPTRYYVLVDQSGSFERIIEENLERAHQQRVLEAFRQYVTRYALAAVPSTPTSGTHPPTSSRPAGLPDAIAEGNPRALEGFTQQGGAPHFLALLRPRLRPDAPDFAEPRRVFRRVPLPADAGTNADLATLAERLKPYLRGARTLVVEGREVNVHAAILIPARIADQVVRPGAQPAGEAISRQGIEYWSANLADVRLREDVERAVNEEVRRREYVARGMDLTSIRQVERTYVPVASLTPRREAGREAVGTTDVIRQWAPSAFVYLLWVSIFSIIQMLLNNTIEEKSNRIIEVLLSSVTPGELMIGKLAGIAAVGLTMVGAWVLSLVLVLVSASGPSSSVAGPLFTVLRTSNLLPAFGFYFLFGFLMYAGVILSLGSLCNTLKEAQNYMGVIVLVMMVPMLTMMFIPKDPNGTVARVLSWVPCYTPFIMMNRTTADPPWFDVLGTMVLLLGSTALVIWLSGRIFRMGILRTGQPPKFLELLRWLRG